MGAMVAVHFVVWIVVVVHRSTLEAAEHLELGVRKRRTLHARIIAIFMLCMLAS